MKRLFPLILTLITLNLPSIAFCAPPANAITLSSYYPAPFGAYDRLRLVPRADLDGLPCEDGSLYFKDSNNTIQICRGTTWTSLTGLWSMTSRAPGFDPANPSARVDQYYPSIPYPDLTLRKPYIGIGTNNPLRPLHIVADDSGTPEAVIIENLSTIPNSGASISFRGVLGSTAMSEFVNLQAKYQNLTSAAAESSLAIHMRDGTGSGMQEQFTFKGNGFLGVRDPNPSAVLELAGNAINGPPVFANTLPYMIISTNQVNPGNVLTVLANGNFGINQPNPTEKLEVVGNIKATMLILTSDARLKKTSSLSPTLWIKSHNSMAFLSRGKMPHLINVNIWVSSRRTWKKYFRKVFTAPKGLKVLIIHR